MKITSHTGKLDLNVKNASDFVKAISSGKSPEEAALVVGSSLKSLMRDPHVLAALEDLVQYHFTKAEVRRAILIARNMKIVLTGEDRDATAASRVLALDPELGLHTDSGPTININLSEDLQSLDPGPIWDEDSEPSSPPKTSNKP